MYSGRPLAVKFLNLFSANDPDHQSYTPPSLRTSTVPSSTCYPRTSSSHWRCTLCVLGVPFVRRRGQTTSQTCHPLSETGPSTPDLRSVGGPSVLLRCEGWVLQHRPWIVGATEPDCCQVLVSHYTRFDTKSFIYTFR